MHQAGFVIAGGRDRLRVRRDRAGHATTTPGDPMTGSILSGNDTRPMARNGG